MKIQDVIHLAFSLERVAASMAMSLLTLKLEDTVKNMSDVDKSEEENTRDVATLIRVICHFHEIGVSFIETGDILDSQGFCYVSKLLKTHWLDFAYHFIGEYPSPWLVRCLYMAQEGLVSMPQAIKVRGEHDKSYSNFIKCSCAYCSFVISVLRDNPRKLELAPPSERLLFREDMPGLKYHFVGIHIHASMDWDSEKKLREIHGPGYYVTMKWMRQRESFFLGKVGTPETVVLADEEETSKDHSTIYPFDSASCVTPRANNRSKKSEKQDDMITMLSSQIADLTANISNLQARSKIGDYERYEYDADLQEAFESSGVIVIGEDSYLRPLAKTNASELVPKLTIDDRLNFLIRLHTAVFRVVPNSDDYPTPGISSTLRSAMEGKLPDDHPSFDLLQIVVTDTFDWNHQIVKNNNFLLPVLERGMKFNERIICLCLKALKDEYSTRWRSLVKDCILPVDITDTSRWSDKYDRSCGMRITSKRPDMAIRDRDSVKRTARKHRKDSFFG